MRRLTETEFENRYAAAVKRNPCPFPDNEPIEAAIIVGDCDSLTWDEAVQIEAMLVAMDFENHEADLAAREEASEETEEERRADFERWAWGR